MRETLFGLEKPARAPRRDLRRSLFSYRETVELCAKTLVASFLGGKSVTPREIFDAVPIFATRGLKDAKTIGDALGGGRGGLGAYRNRKGALLPCFENGSLVLHFLDAQVQERLASALNIESVEGLASKIAALPKAAALEPDLFGSTNAIAGDETIADAD